MRRLRRTTWVLVFAALLAAAAAALLRMRTPKPDAARPGRGPGPIVLATRTGYPSENRAAELELIRDAIASRDRRPPRMDLAVLYPNDGSLFPPEIVAPALTWDNPGRKCGKWLI